MTTLAGFAMHQIIQPMRLSLLTLLLCLSCWTLNTVLLAERVLAVP